MNKFHSTVSRRDFMKALGLGAAGIGAASATAPVFKDIDELTATSDGYTEKRPWYVKERDYLDSTTEVDWNIKKRFDGASYSNFHAHLTPEHFQQRLLQLTERRNQDCRDNTPGLDLRSRVLGQAGWINLLAQAPFLFSGEGLEMFDQPALAMAAEGLGMITHSSYGVPRWQGTPEENATMMRSVIRWAGGGTVGFSKVDERTIKLINSTNSNLQPGVRQEILFKEADRGYQTPTEMVIPNKCKYVVTTAVRESVSHARYAPTDISLAFLSKAYSQVAIVALRVMNFLRGIGYASVSGGFAGIWYNNVGWGVMTGLGELSRMKGLLTPETGPANILRNWERLK